MVGTEEMEEGGKLIPWSFAPLPTRVYLLGPYLPALARKRPLAGDPGKLSLCASIFRLEQEVQGDLCRCSQYPSKRSVHRVPASILKLYFFEKLNFVAAL